MSAEVTKTGILDMQVCVPKHWTDGDVLLFANKENECGTEHGWQIRRKGSELLAGAEERTTCNDRSSHVHVMLDA